MAALEAWQEAPDESTLSAVKSWDMDRLDALVRFQVPEGLHVEYKSAAWLEGLSKKAQLEEVRRYVAGFMNADGGIIVMGIRERVRDTDEVKVPDRVEPFRWQHKGPFREWVERAVQQGGILPIPSKMPAVHVVEDGDGAPIATVVSVTPATDHLVAALYKGSQVFFARLGESTMALDEWAVRAILLGRRRTPRVTLGFDSTGFFKKVGGEDLDFDYIDHKSWNRDGVTRKHIMKTRLYFTNESFVWAERVDWGLLVSERVLDGPRTEEVPCPAMLRGHIETEKREVFHLRGLERSRDIGPFGVETFELEVRFWGPSLVDKPFEMHLAMYIVAQGAMPLWFRIEVRKTSKGLSGLAWRAVPAELPVRIGLWTEDIPKNCHDWYQKK